MSRVFEWLKHEISTALYAILYFAITFNLVSLSENLILKQDAIKRTSYMGATLGALFAGKVVLIANSLPFINAFPNKPLFRNILWKFSIYGFFAILVQLLDQFIRIIYHHQNIILARQDIIILLTSPRFWGIQIWVLLLFFMFTVFLELTHVIGKKEMIRILFYPNLR